MSRGIFVLGMHRSGTSVAARLINLLGVPLGRSDDLVPARSDNPGGFWESAALVRVNDEILESFGGSWVAPPPLLADWPSDPTLHPHRAKCRLAFEAVYRTEQWLWKDPRNCLTLPFWLDVLDVRPVVVIVYRNPLEVCQSLAKRDGLSRHLSVALWERYVRQSLANASGLRTLVTSYAQMITEPAAWVRTIHSFLSDSGFDLAMGVSVADLQAFVDPKRRHARFGERDVASHADLSHEQKSLFSLMGALEGEHTRLPAIEGLPETRWTEPLLAERRSQELLRAEHERVRLLLARGEVLAAVPEGATFILVDQEQWRGSFEDRRPLPFLEREGCYWGPPPDGETAIAELERLRKAGARAIVFASPAFWWLEHYTSFAHHLHRSFRHMVATERIVAFDLGQARGGTVPP